MTELVHVSTERSVTTITLDSPHNRNALSRALVDQLGTALRDAAGDDIVRAIVLTHTGGTFCAGADLGEARAGSMTQGADDLFGLLTAIVEAPKPVIGRIAGHVRAGGMGLVAACDIVLADGRATFGVTESRIGLAPAVISAALLPRLTARAAGRYFLTGETFDPETAVAIGLITEACDDVEERMASLLDVLRACSPQGLRESKAIATAALRASLQDNRAHLTELSARLFASEEATEGMTAFLERRKPRWAVETP